MSELASESMSQGEPPVVTAAGREVLDGLPVLAPRLPSCRRRYLLVDFPGTAPYTGPWRREATPADVIVLRGEVSVGLPPDETVVVRPGEQVTIPAGQSYRLVARHAALFELYLPGREPDR